MRPEVQRALETMFVPVRLNVDDYPATAETFGVRRWPADVILAPNGQFIAHLNCPQVPAEYLAQLERALCGPDSRPYQGAVAANIGSAGTASQAANFAPAEGGIVPSTGAAIGHNALPARKQRALDRRTPHSAATIPLARPATVSPDMISDNSNSRPVLRPLPLNTGPPATRRHQATRPHFDQFAAGAAPEARTSAARFPQPSQPAGSIVGSAYGPVEQLAPPPISNAQPQSITGARQQLTAPPPGGGQAVWGSTIASFPMIPAAEAPPVGLDGFCPVQLSKHRDKWTKGDPRYGVIHRGRTYLFSGPAEQQEFLTNPDQFSPVMGGDDPVFALDHGQQVPGQRKFGRFHGDRVYLFATEESLAKFLSRGR